VQKTAISRFSAPISVPSTPLANRRPATDARAGIVGTVGRRRAPARGGCGGAEQENLVKKMAADEGGKGRIDSGRRRKNQWSLTRKPEPKNLSGTNSLSSPVSFAEFLISSLGKSVSPIKSHSVLTLHPAGVQGGKPRIGVRPCLAPMREGFCGPAGPPAPGKNQPGSRPSQK
jgi:hypothetical protein